MVCGGQPRKNPGAPIIGNLSNTSDEKAADVNGDGVVNVADIMKIITTIMGAE
jgi:hypothetical protein